jgi:hypothetical protein
VRPLLLPSSCTRGQCYSSPGDDYDPPETATPELEDELTPLEDESPLDVDVEVDPVDVEAPEVAPCVLVVVPGIM